MHPSECEFFRTANFHCSWFVIRQDILEKLPHRFGFRRSFGVSFEKRLKIQNKMESRGKHARDDLSDQVIAKRPNYGCAQRRVMEDVSMFQYLTQFCSLQDLLTLKRVNRCCRDGVERLHKSGSTVKLLKTALQSLGLDETFLTALHESKAVISGSFLLKILTGGSWTAGDIDVYHQGSAPDFGYLYNRLHTNAVETWLNDRTSGLQRQTRSHTTDLTVGLYQGFMTGCKHFALHDFDLNGTKVQNIYTDKSPFEMILTKFDADFLKNTFDGKTLTIWNVPAFSSGTSEYHTENPHDKESTNLRRLRKYMDRGFAFTNACRVVTETAGIKIRHYFIRDALIGADIEFKILDEVAPCPRRYHTFYDWQYRACRRADLEEAAKTSNGYANYNDLLSTCGTRDILQRWTNRWVEEHQALVQKEPHIKGWVELQSKRQRPNR